MRRFISSVARGLHPSARRPIALVPVRGARPRRARSTFVPVPGERLARGSVN